MQSYVNEEDTLCVVVKNENHLRNISVDLNEIPDSEELMNEDCSKKKGKTKVEDSYGESKLLDLNEISAPEQLKYFIEGSNNSFICVLYKIYFPFVLGCEERELLVDLNEDISDTSTLKSDACIEEVVHMMTNIYFSSILWK